MHCNILRCALLELVSRLSSWQLVLSCQSPWSGLTLSLPPAQEVRSLSVGCWEAQQLAGGTYILSGVNSDLLQKEPFQSILNHSPSTNGCSPKPWSLWRCPILQRCFGSPANVNLPPKWEFWETCEGHRRQEHFLYPCAAYALPGRTIREPFERYPWCSLRKWHRALVSGCIKQQSSHLLRSSLAWQHPWMLCSDIWVFSFTWRIGSTPEDVLSLKIRPCAGDLELSPERGEQQDLL